MKRLVFPVALALLALLLILVWPSAFALTLTVAILVELSILFIFFRRSLKHPYVFLFFIAALNCATWFALGYYVWAATGRLYVMLGISDIGMRLWNMMVSIGEAGLIAVETLVIAMLLKVTCDSSKSSWRISGIAAVVGLANLISCSLFMALTPGPHFSGKKLAELLEDIDSSLAGENLMLTYCGLASAGPPWTYLPLAQDQVRRRLENIVIAENISSVVATRACLLMPPRDPVRELKALVRYNVERGGMMPIEAYVEKFPHEVLLALANLGDDKETLRGFARRINTAAFARLLNEADHDSATEARAVIELTMYARIHGKLGEEAGALQAAILKEHILPMTEKSHPICVEATKYLLGTAFSAFRSAKTYRESESHFLEKYLIDQREREGRSFIDDLAERHMLDLGLPEKQRQTCLVELEYPKEYFPPGRGLEIGRQVIKNVIAHTDSEVHGLAKALNQLIFAQPQLRAELWKSLLTTPRPRPLLLADSVDRMMPEEMTQLQTLLSSADPAVAQEAITVLAKQNHLQDEILAMVEYSAGANHRLIDHICFPGGEGKSEQEQISAACCNSYADSLTHKDGSRRMSAVKGLKKCHQRRFSPATTQGLLEALKSRDPEVRKSAINALNNADWKIDAADWSGVSAVLKEVFKHSRDRDEKIAALKAVDAACEIKSAAEVCLSLIPSVFLLSSDPESYIRYYVVIVLEESGRSDSVALKVFDKFLQDSSAQVRARSAYALGRTQNEKARQILVRNSHILLSDLNIAEENTEVLAAIGAMKKDAAVFLPMIKKMTLNGSERVRLEAFRALCDLRESHDDLDRFIRLGLNDPAEHIRNSVHFCLARRA